MASEDTIVSDMELTFQNWRFFQTAEHSFLAVLTQCKRDMQSELEVTKQPFSSS